MKIVKKKSTLAEVTEKIDLLLMNSGLSYDEIDHIEVSELEYDVLVRNRQIKSKFHLAYNGIIIKKEEI